MQPYQLRYIENTKKIADMISFYRGAGSDFDSWYRERKDLQQEITSLREDNLRLLNDYLFPTLDELYSASAETIKDLEDFAADLLDWHTNLDCGVYLVIHDSLLSLCRTRKDRNGIIRELYLVGMGLYFQRRMVEGVDSPLSQELMFQNEMAFTEASSYFRFFEDIDDEETRGYMIRAYANIAICSKDYHKKIAATNTALKIIQDEHYRELAPDLPWERFLRAAHQQMSSNRSDLAREKLTKEELALVLESCYEVFKPESETDNPSIRWLWPYYDMEYSCGYVDLKTTMERLETLIDQSPEDQYDQSGLYGNVQLPIYYGRLIKANPQLQSEEHYIRYFAKAYRKMEKMMLSYPSEKKDDFTVYLLTLVISDYYEMEGVTDYRRFMVKLMQQFAGDVYIRSRRIGDIMRAISEAILENDPGFFDDIPRFGSMSAEEKMSEIPKYAEECGLFHALGMIKMNVTRTMETRNLFASEEQIYQLYVKSGYDDLAARKTTEMYADIALGHRIWYSGNGGYPESYERIDSPFRQMTDVCALSVYLAEGEGTDIRSRIDRLLLKDDGKFSPLVLSYVSDEKLKARISDIITDDGKKYYREVYDQLYEQS